jgi:hypothetical protein
MSRFADPNLHRRKHEVVRSRLVAPETSPSWEGLRKKSQDSEPYPGNPAVRDYRRASGNVVMANVNPTLQPKGQGS